MAEGDIEAVSAVRVTSWQSAYQGIVPQAYLDAMTIEADAARRRETFQPAGGRSTNLVAVDANGDVVGWASLGPLRGPGTQEPRAGELYALYVKPVLIGSGVGRALLDAAHEHAAARGFRAVSLWVLRDNRRARRFYERAGYVWDGTVQDDDYDGRPVPEVRYHRAMADSKADGAQRRPQGQL
jgi:ribosomal protein S18 acetylase RimI-like enzyme